MAASIEQIAEDLKKYLLAHERTQRDIAKKLGVSPSHISNYLRGDERISRRVADRIAEVFPEVSAAYLLTGEGSLTGSVSGIQQNVQGRGNTGIGQVIQGDAALKAENDRLREENEWLRGMVESLSKK